jgi:ribonuclease Z
MGLNGESPAEGAMTLRGRFRLAVLLLCLCASSVLQMSAQVDGGVPPRTIRVTLLGTASGPRVHAGMAGISTLVEAGGERFLIDAGRGVMPRLVQAGFPMNAVTKLFVTHLHSDHVIDVPDLMLTPWSAQPERRVPLEVWGPEGTRAMMRHLQQAFAFDIRTRRDVDESFSPAGIRLDAHDIREGKVYERNGVTITALLVTHGLVTPSYGYRIDYSGRSVVLSGDTSPSDNLVAISKGVDVLIHEAIDLEVLRRLVSNPQRMEAIVARHTTPEQAASVFRRVSPRLAVFSHSPGTPAIVTQTKRFYSGRVEMGTDLMVIDIGDDVRVRPGIAAVRPQ